VEKLIKAELLQSERDQDEGGEGGGDDEDVDLADKIQAEVVGADSKADGHALAGGNMDEGDNIMPPDVDDSGDDAGESGELEEEEDLKHDAGDKTHEHDDGAAVDEAAAKPKEKKRKTSTKPGEGSEAQDSSTTARENDGAESSGIIIVTNALMEGDDDYIAEADFDAHSLAVALPSDRSGISEVDMLKKWQDYSSESSVASRELCEALRLILEPTLASKMHGDFKTGKRINMRKVQFHQTLKPPSFLCPLSCNASPFALGHPLHRQQLPSRSHLAATRSASEARVPDCPLRGQQQEHEEQRERRRGRGTQLSRNDMERAAAA
jgi:midasin (ATPase involved in ribosome maturation)